jgi:glycosyltransferase involved in cell wall biosynthesis
MKVLQVSNFYPPYWVGGYEQIAEWVAIGLRERGHQVDVLTGRGPAFGGRPEIHGDLDLDLGELANYFTKGMSFNSGMRGNLSRHVFSPLNFRACRRAIREVQPDLVSFWNPAYISFSPLLAARWEGIPAVVHLSDTVANVFRNPHPPINHPRLRRLGCAGVDFLLRLARPARFVVPSTFLKQKFVSREGLPESRTTVLHWPVEPTVSRAVPPERGPSEHPRLLFVGTLLPEKGPDVLIEAFAEAHRQRPDLTLTIVGEGSSGYVAGLVQKAHGLPIRFLGRLDRAAVTRTYSEHDVLVFPSVWDEPYAVVPPEAMAMGLAVIGTTAGGTPEAVIDGKTGLLVPPRDPGALRDAMLRLCQDPDLACRLAKDGQEWARSTQSFAAFTQQLEDLYQEAVRQVSPP